MKVSGPDTGTLKKMPGVQPGLPLCFFQAVAFGQNFLYSHTRFCIPPEKPMQHI